MACNTYVSNDILEWVVELDEQFERDFDRLPADVQDEILAHAQLLEKFGPGLGRPRVDKLQGSNYASMKELRFETKGGVWRIAFAFDPRRKAVLLAGGSKSGTSEKRFYRQLIRLADQRFAAHLARLKR